MKNTKFQREVNIFSKKATLKRFQANETNFSVLKGKIEALISESEIIELQNGKVTMYSKLTDVKLTVDGLAQEYSDISSKYDSVSGQYTSLDAKVAEYKSGVDGLTQNLSHVQTDLKNNYSTTAAMNAAIKAEIDGFSSKVSKTYATGSDVEQKLKTADATAQEYADAAKQAAIDTAKASTDELLKSYATVKQMQSAIDQKADSITSTVSSTYATKASVTSLETWKKEASQKITDSAIISTVSSSSAWQEKADKASLISQINQTAESVTIQASKISLEGTVTANNYFKINADGSMDVKHGTIGGWDIENDSLTANGITLSAKEGKLKVNNADGKEILRITSGGMALNNTDEITIFRLLTSGMFFYDSTGTKRKTALSTAGMVLYTDYTDANNYKALRLGKYGLYAVKKDSSVEELWMEGDTSRKWDGYIIRYLENAVRVNANTVYTDGCSMGKNLTTKGTLSVAGNTTLDGKLYFYDWENQSAKSPTYRTPISSASADGSRVAYIGAGQTYAGTNDMGPLYSPCLSIRGQFGGNTDYVTTKFYSGSAPSDVRLKKNIKDSIINALETIDRMQVRQFDWRANNAHQNIGFVADEIEKLDPNLTLGGGCDENGEMDIKQINSPYLLNYAIKAIQELYSIVKEQEKTIKQLKKAS